MAPPSFYKIPTEQEVLRLPNTTKMTQPKPSIPEFFSQISSPNELKQVKEKSKESQIQINRPITPPTLLKEQLEQETTPKTNNKSISVEFKNLSTNDKIIPQNQRSSNPLVSKGTAKIKLRNEPRTQNGKNKTSEEKLQGDKESQEAAKSNTLENQEIKKPQKIFKLGRYIRNLAPSLSQYVQHRQNKKSNKKANKSCPDTLQPGKIHTFPKRASKSSKSNTP